MAPGHHGVRGLLTAILCRRKQLDLPHSFALFPKFEAGKPGGESVSALPYSRALTKFSGRNAIFTASQPEFSGRRDNPVVNAGLSGAILRPAQD